MPDDLTATIDGARLRDLRLARHLSQEQLAELSGVKQSTISKIEGGSAQNPRYETAVLLGRALGVDPRRLVAEGDFFDIPPTGEPLDLFTERIKLMFKQSGRDPSPEELASIEAFVKDVLDGNYQPE